MTVKDATKKTQSSTVFLIIYTLLGIDKVILPPIIHKIRVSAMTPTTDEAFWRYGEVAVVNLQAA